MKGIIPFIIEDCSIFKTFLWHIFLFNFSSRRSGCPPKIVVDAPSCFSMWCRGLDCVIGLQVQELIHRLRSFVEAFDEMGAELVFFVGGLTPFKKRKTWLNRRIKSMHLMMNAFDMLYAGRTSEEISKNNCSIPPNMSNFVSFVLKYVLNCRVSFNSVDFYLM